MYTYLYPVYFLPGFFVKSTGPILLQRAWICLVGDSRTGLMVAYSISLGPPPRDLYQCALQSYRSSSTISRSILPGLSIIQPLRVPEPNSSSLRYNEPQTDVLHQSLIFRKKRKVQSVIDESKLAALVVQYLYDWPLHVHNQVHDPYVVPFATLISLIDSAIFRINEEILGKPDWFIRAER